MSEFARVRKIAKEEREIADFWAVSSAREFSDIWIGILEKGHRG
jgi:hypothetical protein